MQDELQQVEVPGRNGLEEVPADDLGACREPTTHQLRFRVLDDIRAVEDNPSQPWIGLQQQLK